MLPLLAARRAVTHSAARAVLPPLLAARRAAPHSSARVPCWRWLRALRSASWSSKPRCRKSHTTRMVRYDSHLEEPLLRALYITPRYENDGA